MLCTTTVSPVRTKLISASSCGRLVSLPEALSVKTLATSMPSSCRSVFWSMELTRMYPMRCPSIDHVRKVLYCALWQTHDPWTTKYLQGKEGIDLGRCLHDHAAASVRHVPERWPVGRNRDRAL